MVAGRRIEQPARRRARLYLAGRYREAADLTEGLLAELDEEPGLLGAMVERLLGYAVHQGRGAEGARPHFARSLEIAEDSRRPAFEIALTRKAMSDTRYAAEEDLATRCQAPRSPRRHLRPLAAAALN